MKYLLLLLAGIGLSLCVMAENQPTENQPQTVTPTADGHLQLLARHAKGVGPRIEFIPEWDAFGWFTADDRIEWQLADVTPGHYQVIMTWSVSDEEAGKPFVVEAEEHQLEAAVGKSGSWETFVTAPLGDIYLTGEVEKLVLRPTSRFDKGALLDLRKLELVPAE